MKPKLVFAVGEIKEKGGLTCSETLAASEVAEDAYAWKASIGDVRLAHPCEVRPEFSVGGESILMEGRVQGQWEAECSRCLASHNVDFEVALEETYPLTQDTIDLREDVRQAMVLSVPDKPLCSPTCRGLCPSCGKDLNQGPCGCVLEKPSLLDRNRREIRIQKRK